MFSSPFSSLEVEVAITYASISYILGIPSAIFCGAMLVAIGLSVTRPENPRDIRRHTGVHVYWRLQPELLERSEGVLHTGYHVPRHNADLLEDPITVMHYDLESARQVGRRGAESPARNMPVSHDWRPCSGELRIALLETRTAEYLFARKPKDQLDTARTQFVRSYA